MAERRYKYVDCAGSPRRRGRHRRDYRLRQEFITPYTEQNGIVERFFHSLKDGYVWQHNFTGFAEARSALLSGLTGITPSVRIKRSAITARDNPEPYNPNWWIDFGRALHSLSSIDIRQ